MSRPVAVVGDELLCPGCPKPPYTPTGYIITGSPNVFIGGRPAARVGDQGVCGAITSLVTGSETVFINNRPAHRVGDLNSCKGPTYRPSIHNCFIG